MKYYDGAAPCAGCGRPGTEISRPAKDALCKDCSEALAIGRQVIAENSAEVYVSAFLHYHQFASGKGNEAIHAFLSKIENSSAVTRRYENIVSNPYNNGRRYKIMQKDFEAVRDLCLAFAEEFNRVRDEERAITQKAREEANAERNKIFNEGVAYGRNLLGQLNRGEINLQQFNAFVKEY